MTTDRTPQASPMPVAVLLRRALKQLSAWQAKYGAWNPQWLPPAGDVRLAEDIDEWLAAAPAPTAQPVELSEEQIQTIGKSAFGIDPAFDGHLMKFARAIIAAHKAAQPGDDSETLRERCNFLKGMLDNFYDSAKLSQDAMQARIDELEAQPGASAVPVDERAVFEVGDARFEAWAESEEYDCTKVTNEHIHVTAYTHSDTFDAFRGWRAALAAPQAVPAQPQGDALDGWQPMETAPKKGLVDIWTDRRHIDCYYDSICAEYRTITAGHLIRLRDAKFWQQPPPAPLAARQGDQDKTT